MNEKYDPKYAKQAEKIARLGATDDELADILDISSRTVRRWGIAHEEFSKGLAVGKAEADERVQRALYHRALGYEIDDVKIFMPAGAKEATIVPHKRVVDPDTTAQIFWLKNRRPKEWRDRQEVEHSISESLADRMAEARKRITEK